MNAIKVRELNKYIKKYIAMDYLLADVTVEGEISNFKKHTNGNLYFSLKDDYAKINAIMYFSEACSINFSPKNGDSVIVKGSVSIFEKDGLINLYVRDMKIVGLGDLYERYLSLKESLYKEGIFDESKKKKIPYFPQRVGVITSPTGAAIRDIINVLSRRNPAVDILLYPSNVQGDFATSQLIEGLNYFEKNPVDVIIIGRGGGSLEELFCFNDEELARKIYSMSIPIISAVGHEIDYVISDFVSDLRAPTPSAAAEMVSMSKEDLENRLSLLKNRLDKILQQKVEDNTSRIDLLGEILNIKFEKFYANKLESLKKLDLENSKWKLIYKVKYKKQNLELTFNNLDMKFNKKISINKNLLYNIGEKLRSSKFTQRIYLKNKFGAIVSSVKDLSVGDEVLISFADGTATANISKTKVGSGIDE
ncbi:exodeoxyribonuclease VII large subunit [Peptoniphilus sp. oral taxon 386]|uniref:exodeoxyribonuclease VII large subunit n=1 Tax=Peptoniphilus sp. oral taxon 386 TaxID=652713 RepID=UPI0001DA9AEC|nr:exodeoxyribonuclease VII large subunit [Peptoniphilus sp. oral taxon 386]EFI42054.1 exodeoxyribonuclease VII, large subunit [Peptoniphilus sp. oral taxon 386 str. F0131]